MCKPNTIKWDVTERKGYNNRFFSLEEWSYEVLLIVTVSIVFVIL